MRRFLPALLLLVCFTGANAQYCVPDYLRTGIGEGTAKVISLTGASGSTLFDTLPYAALAGGWANRSLVVAPVALQQGRAYSGSVTYHQASQLAACQVWIDFNDDRIFADSEAVSQVTPNDFSYSSTLLPFTVRLPTAASTGAHLMRIRNVRYNTAGFLGYNNTNLSSCSDRDAVNQYFNGATADYQVNILPASACSGVPEAGSVLAPTDVCSGTGFQLGVAGDSVAGNLAYQWYNNTTGSMLPIAGATTKFYNVSGFTAATSYKLVVTCLSSGLQDSTLPSTVALKATYQCYCANPTGGNNRYVRMDSVAIAETGLNLTGTGSIAYSAYLDTGMATTTLLTGVTYSLFAKSSGTKRYRTLLWLDANNNGSFEPSEYVSIDSNTQAGGLAYGSFTVPLGADTGITGMRVRITPDTVITALDACAFDTASQTRDFLVRIALSTPCGSVPSIGVVRPSTRAVCPSAPFFLLATGYTSVSGLAFQWMSRTSSSAPFVPIIGATNTLYKVPTQTDTTDYKLRVTCLATRLVDSTSAVVINMLPQFLCYCSPLTGVTLNEDALTTPDSVSISGTTLNTFSASAPIYTQFFPSTGGTTAALSRNTEYRIFVKSRSSDNYNAYLWVDYNRNGAFDNAESVVLGRNITGGASASAAFTLPSIADTGATGMRVRITKSTSVLLGSDACTNVFYGGTADFVVRIDTSASCSGTPAGGAASSSATAVCSGQPFTLSSTGATNQRGVTYQWLSSAGSGAYSAIAGATTLTYVVPSQAAARNYRLLVTCSFSGRTDTSLAVAVGQSPAYMCNCAPSRGAPLHDSAYQLGIDSLSLVNGTIGDGTPGSRDVFLLRFPPTTTTTSTLSRGSTYGFWVAASGSQRYNAAAWIDYNQDGTYQTTEYISIARNVAAATAATVAFGVPATVPTGTTSLRVRVAPATDSLSAADACTRYAYGATREYVVTIGAAVTCAGRPSAGAAAATAASVCVGVPFVVRSVGYSNGAGISFQWLKFDTSGVSLIAGATSPVYNVPNQNITTAYALIANCTASGIRDTSRFFTVTESPFYACYCSPRNGFDLNGFPWPAPIDSVYIPTTTLANYTPYSDALYVWYNPPTTTTTASLDRAGRYTLRINSYGGSSYNAAAWIDANRNGVFENSEYTLLGTSVSAGTTAGASFTIPILADTGLTGMRVRVAEQTSFISSPDACSYFANGSTRDYVVRIAPGASCTGAPNAGRVIPIVAGVCPSTSFTLLDTGATLAVGITYQWYARPIGSTIFSPISGASTTTLNVAAQAVTTAYYLMVTCTGSGTSAMSNTVVVRTNPFYTCYCTGTLADSSSGVQLDLVKIPGTTLNITGTYSPIYKIFSPVRDSTGTVQRSLSYPLNFRTTGGARYDAAAWIDYSKDGVFQSSEYIFLDTNAVSGALNSRTLTIPATADTGLTGMRVRVTPGSNTISTGDACTYIANSQTYDLAIKIDTLSRCSGRPEAGTITAPFAIACPTMSIPITDSGYSLGSGLSFQWYVRTTSGYTAISGATGFNYTVTGQTVTSQYMVVARCSFSGLSDSTNVITLTQNPFDSCYCSPSTGVPLVSGGGDTLLLIASISGTSLYSPTQTPGSDGYVYVPPTLSYNTATMLRGSGYTAIMYVNSSRYSITDAGMWVDYDHSSTYEASEYLHLTRSSGRDNWAGTLSIPATALLGNTGMRVIATTSGTIGASSSCSLLSAAHVQDHIITILRPPCYAISRIRTSGVTDSSALVSWGPVGTYYQYVLDTISTPPAASGSVTTDTFVSFRCLVSNRTYFMHVRDSCGPGDLSGWVTIGFTTAACRATGSPSVTAVGVTTATLSWGAVAGSVGYEYVLDTSARVPSATGTATAATSVSFTGLLQGTTYNFYVRSGCRCSNRSAWQTVSFTTICDTLRRVVVYNILDTAATIRWDSIRGVSTYEYAVTRSATPPSGAGLAVSDTSRTVNGLLPGTAYFAHVRHMCRDSYSGWTTIAFTTSRCDTVTALTVYPGDTVVRITWSPPSTGATGYYYLVNTSPLAPAGTGIPTSGTTIIEGALSTSTTYYVHVRTQCSGGLARWQTLPFVTLACDTVSGISVSNICDTNADIAWVPGAGIGYLYVVNNSRLVPTVTGIFSSVASANVRTLSPSTTYYVHVRKLCTATDTSDWVTSAPFTTSMCDPVTGLRDTAVGTTTAVLFWDLMNCVAGYQWIVDLTPGDPTISGTFSALPYVNLSTLLPNTTYYAHVRAECGGGVFSNWTTISFTTARCDATNITISGITSSDATVTWGAISGAIGYQYKVDNNPTPPISFATTTATTYAATGLVPELRYYAHVRVDCGGLYSVWADSPFVTAPVSVPTISNAGNEVSLYPNPATDRVVVLLANVPNNGFVTLTDISGKVLQKHAVTIKKYEVDLSHVSAGSYLLRYQDEHTNQVFKLTKQ